MRHKILIAMIVMSAFLLIGCGRNSSNDMNTQKPDIMDGVDDTSRPGDMANDNVNDGVTDQNQANDHVDGQNQANNVTDQNQGYNDQSTTDPNENNGGMIENMGENIGNAVEDVGDGVGNAVKDVTR